MAFRTSILLPIPDAEPLVGPLRHLYDPADAAGVGAHVTLLFPFVPAPQLDANVIADVATMFGKNRPLDLIFDRVVVVIGGRPAREALKRRIHKACRPNERLADLPQESPQRPRVNQEPGGSNPCDGPGKPYDGDRE